MALSLNCSICGTKNTGLAFISLHEERDICTKKVHILCLKRLLISNGAVEYKNLFEGHCIYRLKPISIRSPCCQKEIFPTDMQLEKWGIPLAPYVSSELLAIRQKRSMVEKREILGERPFEGGVDTILAVGFYYLVVSCAWELSTPLIPYSLAEKRAKALYYFFATWEEVARHNARSSHQRLGAYEGPVYSPQEYIHRCLHMGIKVSVLETLFFMLNELLCCDVDVQMGTLSKIAFVVFTVLIYGSAFYAGASWDYHTRERMEMFKDARKPLQIKHS